MQPAPTPPGQHAQQGFATLFVSVLLLFVTSIITLYTGRAAVVEQRVSVNDYETRRLSEATEAGIHRGVDWLQTQNNANTMAWSLDPADADFEIASTTLTGSLSSDSHYETRFRRPTGQVDHIQIVATSASTKGGITAAGSRHEILMNRVVARNPETAVLIDGCMQPVTGHPTIANDDNPTGDAIVTSQSASCIDTDPNHMNLQGNVRDNAFTGNAWEQVFGASKADMQALAAVDGDVHWVTPSDLSNNTWHQSLGDDSTNPVQSAVLIFADGACPEINGGTTIVGVVYYEGPCNTNGWGQGTVKGSLIMDDDMKKLNSNTELRYRAEYLASLQDKLVGINSQIPGSWIDAKP